MVREYYEEDFLFKFGCFFVFACKEGNNGSVTRDALPTFESPEEFAYAFAEKYYRHVELKEELDFDRFCVPEIIPLLQLKVPYRWSEGKVTEERIAGYRFAVKKEKTLLTKEGDEYTVDFFFVRYENNGRSQLHDEIEIKVIQDEDGFYKISSYIAELSWGRGLDGEYMDALRDGKDVTEILKEIKYRFEERRRERGKDSLELEMLRKQRKGENDFMPYSSYGLNRQEIKQ